MTQEMSHRTNIELELSKNNLRSLLPIPRPKPVSGERIAPNQCTRIAMQRLIETGWACGGALALQVVSAGPQSRDFKR
jgi:hypothetical protein